MATSSPNISALTRKNEQLILRGLASVGQKTVADAMGKDESTISRWKDGEIARIGQLLAVLGLKVVPTEYRAFDPQLIDSVLFLAQQRMGQFNGADSLEEVEL